MGEWEGQKSMKIKHCLSLYASIYGRTDADPLHTCTHAGTQPATCAFWQNGRGLLHAIAETQGGTDTE